MSNNTELFNEYYAFQRHHQLGVINIDTDTHSPVCASYELAKYITNETDKSLRYMLSTMEPTQLGTFYDILDENCLDLKKVMTWCDKNIPTKGD